MKISDHDMKEFEKLFAPVLDWLDVDVYAKEPEISFNMGSYVDEDRNDFRGVESKRTVCILGYLWYHHKFQLFRDYGTAIIEDIIEKFDFEDEVKVREVLNRMAMVEDKRGRSYVQNLDEMTAYQVAAAIRHFLKTRKIKWKQFLTKDQMKPYTDDDGVIYV